MVSQGAVKSLARSRGRAQVPWPRERLKLGLPASSQVVGTLSGGRAQVPWPRERLMPGLPGSSQVVGMLAGQSSSALGRGRGAEPCSQGGVKSLARSRGRAQVPLAAGEAEAWSPREQSSRWHARGAEPKSPWPRERLRLGLPASSQVVGTLAGQSPSPLAAGEADAWSPREQSSRWHARGAEFKCPWPRERR